MQSVTASFIFQSLWFWRNIQTETLSKIWNNLDEKIISAHMYGFRKTKLRNCTKMRHSRECLSLCDCMRRAKPPRGGPYRRACLRSCYRVWTIVTPYLPDSQRLHWRHYSGYCTLPLELSWTSDHATMCLPPCENCTDCRSSRGSSSSCACSSTSHSLVIHQHT